MDTLELKETIVHIPAHTKPVTQDQNRFFLKKFPAPTAKLLLDSDLKSFHGAFV